MVGETALWINACGVSEAHWRRALRQTPSSGARRCEVSRGAGEPPGPRVECHERWELDDGAGVAVLAGLQAGALPRNYTLFCIVNTIVGHHIIYLTGPAHHSGPTVMP